VRLFLRDAYDTAGNLRSFQGPIAVIGAEHDEVIPVRHAQELYRSLSGTKKMWMITGAGTTTGPTAWTCHGGGRSWNSRGKEQRGTEVRAAELHRTS